MASVMMKDGMPMRVMPKALMTPNTSADRIAMMMATAPRQGHVGDVDAGVLQGEEGDDDADRVGDVGEAQVDLGGSRMTKVRPVAMMPVTEICDRMLPTLSQLANDAARGAEEDDQEQQRDERSDIAQLVRSMERAQACRSGICCDAASAS